MGTDKYNFLLQSAAVINSSLETEDIRKNAVLSAIRLTGCEAAGLLFAEEMADELYYDVAIGPTGEAVRTLRLRNGQGICGRAASLMEPVVLDHFAEGGGGPANAFVTRNAACVPIAGRNGLLGVLQAINKTEGQFGEADVLLLSALAAQVAVAIQNSRVFDELKDTFYAVVKSLAETIEKRDIYTGGHTSRVMRYSLAIGLSLNMSESNMRELELAAILHDIGKVGVRDEVLLKKGTLTTEEFDSIKMHTHYGADILQHIKQLESIVPGVKYHHEKFDGTGYPEGLSGEDIPLAARIIAVADCFDAMVTDRPYRKGRNYEEAFAELQRCAGSQFDGRVVSAFFEAYNKGYIEILKKDSDLAGTV